MATGVELAMESARVRHEQLLERTTAIHVFSDYLPFHRLLRNWLIERKLERDFAPMKWLPEASVEDLRARLPAANPGERRANGLYVGQLSRANLGDPDAVASAVSQIASAFAGLDEQFAAPYLDLTT